MENTFRVELRKEDGHRVYYIYLVAEPESDGVCMGDGKNEPYMLWGILSDLLWFEYEGRLPMDDSPGTDTFGSAWEYDANSNVASYLKKYF